MFVLQVIQPGLAGLMDGSVSTLAPLFAAAFATHKTHATFLVGLAASIGAGISMGFAEALSDDGSLTGRGRPLTRGIVCGLMTALGGLGHTLPYLIPHFYLATYLAAAGLDGSIHMFSARNQDFGKESVLVGPQHENASSLVISPDSKTIAYNRPVNGILQIITTSRPK